MRMRGFIIWLLAWLVLFILGLVVALRIRDEQWKLNMLMFMGMGMKEGTRWAMGRF